MISFDFDGKKVLITGATGGIGSELATQFVKAGATVFLCGTSEEKLVKFKASLVEMQKGAEERIFTGACNFKDKESVIKLVPSAVQVMGGLDILVCNAGATKDQIFIRMTDQDFEDILQINLTSNFILNREAVKVMMKNKFGRIVNIASAVGVAGNAGQANYASAKAGLIGLTKTVAVECAKRGITVNSVAPGFVKTSMTDAIPAELMERFEREIPLGRQGDVKEIASCVLFLSSDEASYITGTVLHANGGLLRP